MTTLQIEGLRAAVAGREILRGIDLTVSSGEVHAVMGPNGAGKSTLSAVVMGKPGYEVLAGSVTLDGVDLLTLPTWERAAAGLHLVMQYPTEVPGVATADMLREALAARGAAITRHRRRPPRRGGAHRAPRTAAAPGPQRGPLRWREEAQRDAAAGRAGAEDRDPRRARLRPRHRRPASVRPTHRGDDRADGRRPRARRARHHPLQPAARRAAPGSRARPRRAARSWRPAGPKSPTSSRRPATPRSARTTGRRPPTVVRPCGRARWTSCSRAADARLVSAHAIGGCVGGAGRCAAPDLRVRRLLGGVRVHDAGGPPRRVAQPPPRLVELVEQGRDHASPPTTPAPRSPTTTVTWPPPSTACSANR